MKTLRLCAGVILSILFVHAASTPAQSQAPGDAARALTGLSNSFETLVERTQPAVVQVFSSGYGPTGRGSTTSDLLGKVRSSGSGVILHPDGYILTNAHVVEAARRVQVLVPQKITGEERGRSILQPKGRRFGAQIVGIDRETDLAVLKVQATGLPYLELSDSDGLRQGQIVLAFGSPYGLENSVSMGVVSSVSRQLRPEDPMIYIQTDATINPGNSGGPLVDTEGRVVGINTFILSHAGGSEGVGFAAPSNIVQNVYNQFRASGRVRRGHIGINAQTITPTMADGLSLPRDWGVVVSDVFPGGPADRAGLRISDVIHQLDGKVMENGRQFDVNLYRHAIGDEVTLDVIRESGPATLRATVVERQDDPTRFSDYVRPDKNLIPKLGILAVDLDRTILQMLPPLRQEDGVVVAARAADAPFDASGLQAGDVIHAMNRDPVHDLKSLRERVRKLRAGDPVVFQVERSGRMKYIAFEVDF
ncbi:MAG: trypsin-like peptidase domain-containing protein [Candidatus Krumholzibacteriia bacterium]